MTLNDQWIAYYDSLEGGFLARFARRLTRWAWRPVTHKVIVWAFSSKSILDSRSLHEMTEFQNRLVNGIKPAKSNP